MTILTVSYKGEPQTGYDEEIARLIGLRVEGAGYAVADGVRDVEFHVDSQPRAEWLAEKVRQTMGLDVVLRDA